jgi:hypothetical protein
MIAVGRVYNQNGGTLYAKEVLQQITHSNRRVGKPRERWEDGVSDDGIMLLGTQTSKTKTKDRES